MKLARHRTSSRPAFALLGALAVTLLVLSGCASAESEQVASLSDGADSPASAQPLGAPLDDGGLAFAKCLREEGVDFPDPDPDGGFEANAEILSKLDLSDPKFKAALKVCADLRPAGTPLDQEFDEATQKAALKLAKCMRKEGVDVPDPQFDANGKLIIGDLMDKIDLSDPNFMKAVRACRQLIPDEVFGG